jgi:hypothetical protein
VSKDARWLFGQILRGKYNQGFQCNFVIYMFTISDLAYIPLFLSHMAPPDYIVILRQAKDACQ